MLERSLRLLFNYPNFYYLFEKYFEVLPVLLIISLGSITLGLFRLLKKGEGNPGTKLLFLLLILSILMVMFINTVYNDTRYTFFIFPVLLMLVLFSIKEFIGSIVKKETVNNTIFIFTVIIFLFASEDFNPYHIWNIDSKEVNFRTIYTDAEEGHYYWRSDVRGVANIINKKLKKVMLL